MYESLSLEDNSLTPSILIALGELAVHTDAH